MNTWAGQPAGTPEPGTAPAPWDPPTAPVPAGWYPDPLNHQLRRYFNGTRWTFWTADTSHQGPPAATPDVTTDRSDAPEVGASSQLRDDIARARADAHALVGAGKEIRQLEQHLRPEERVVALAAAQGTGIGVLACTNQRLLFLFVGIVNRQFIEIDWNRARNVVYYVDTKVFAVYTGKVTKRAIPAFSVRVPIRADAERMSAAAGAASAAPRLDVV